MISRFLLILFSFFSSLSVFGQTDIPLQYAETISASDLKKHLTVIASAEMEGRETGTEGQRRAARYIQTQFQELGLQSPDSIENYSQFFPIKKDSLIPKKFKLGKYDLTYGKDYLLNAASGEDEGFTSKQIVFAGYGIRENDYNDYAGKDVKGKVVLLVAGEPKRNGEYLLTKTTRPSSWSRSTSRKAILAKQMGAKAILIFNPRADTIPGTLKTSNTNSQLYLGKPEDSIHARVPAITITPGMLRQIMDDQYADSLMAITTQEVLTSFSFEAKVKTKLKYKKITHKSTSSNIIGYIEGSDKKDEYLILTAHYDHLGKKGNIIYYGADDDGSGTVSVIEMAEAFARAKAEGHGPRRSIVFMTVSGEEKGLWGSEYYAENPVFPLKNTTVDLNTDMVGRIDPAKEGSRDSANYVYVIGNDKISTDLTPIATEVNKKYTRLYLDFKYNDPSDPQRLYFRSDHYHFAKNGVPVIFFFDGIHEDYHRPTDTVDKINFGLMEKRVRFIFLIAWEIANRENTLKRNLPVPQERR